MPPKRMNRSKKQKGSKPVDRELINSIKATGSTTSTVASDLIDRRQNMNLVQTPPKQIGNQIYWIKEIVTNTFATSTTTWVENNVAFTLSGLNDYTSLVAVFDQYCIYSIAASFHVDGNSSTGVSASLLTALDFDNVSNLGPTGIVGFSNCSETLIGPSTSLVRYLKPCIALAAYTGTFTGYATQRSWLNCTSATVNHYGLRCIALQCAATFNIRVSYEYTVGFRNKW